MEKNYWYVKTQLFASWRLRAVMTLLDPKAVKMRIVGLIVDMVKPSEEGERRKWKT